MTEIPISGEVLEWARNFRGLSQSDAADRLGISVEELQAYETGSKLPNLTKFEKFAAVYCLPQATLFRRTKPTETPLPTDYRTFDGDHHQESFEFLVAVSHVRTLQRTLRLLGEEDDEFTRAHLRTYDLERDAFEQGETERRQLKIPIETQLDWGYADGFRHWRAAIERIGIAVYLQKFSVDDCRGFSLWDDHGLPAIVINKDDRSDNAWTFTLIHEYAHLLIRRPGISDLDYRNSVEAFCNRFAAAFLMPIEAIRRVLEYWPNEPVEWETDAIIRGARKLKVSAQAFAIRLEELNLAPDNFSEKFKFSGPRKRTKATGGNYVNTRLSELGGRFVGSIISALDRAVVDRVAACEALGLPTNHLEKARAYVGRQGELARVE